MTRVLVTLGGARPGNAVRVAIEAVDRVFADCHIDVAVASADGANDLEWAAHTGRNAVAVHQGQLGLRDLMLGADLAVAGGGVTLLELAATATPVVVVEMADNQRPNVQASVSAGFALKAGTSSDPGLGERIEAALRQLAPHATGRREMGARGRELVDGRGASRVVEALFEAAVAGR